MESGIVDGYRVVTFGCTNGTDYDSYELYEPDFMNVAFSDGDKVYSAYYDFTSTIDDDVIDAYTWSDSALAKALPKPEVRYLALSYDDETSLIAESYGVSKEIYEAYVKACKEKGFNQGIDESDTEFSAKNADSIELEIGYYSSEGMTLAAGDIKQHLRLFFTGNMVS